MSTNSLIVAAAVALAVCEGQVLDIWKTFAEHRHNHRTYPDSVIGDLPESFDARTAWPDCPVIREIRDQGHCGSCWAVAAASAMSDRWCISTGESVSLSAQDLTSCEAANTNGCNGGWPIDAWAYFKLTGVVSEACYPYALPSCDHHAPQSPNACPNTTYFTPQCPNPRACDPRSKLDWETDRRRSSSFYTVDGEASLMKDLVSNGPIEVAFIVYEDLYSYAGGIYHHTVGKETGGHAVRLLGYGVENGTKFWTIANSWNSRWGVKGTFRMLRGRNECQIENLGYAASIVRGA